MPDSYSPATFHVHASNIHFSDPPTILGPFVGTPVLTYENLRASCREDDAPEEIFMWVDPQDIMKGNPDGYESWTGDDGDERYFGWRQVRRVPLADDSKVTIAELFGPFFTDLVIVVDREL